jgi:ATP-binding cassette subfamily C protein
MNVLSSTFVDVLTNMKIIKAMALGNRFVSTFLRDAEDNQVKQKAKIFSADFVREIQEPFIAGALVFFLLLAAWHNEALPGGMMVLGVLFVRISGIFYDIQKLHHRLAVRSVKLEGILRSISIAEEMAEAQTGTSTPHLSHSVRFESVDFSYPDGKRALVSSSLEIPVGTTTVLIGASGAGKTSLLDLFLGLHQPCQGRILVDGIPLAEIDLSAWRRSIGYVSQEINLFNASIRMNVALGNSEISDERIWEALRLAGALDFVRALPNGLDHKVGERGLALSGGQRQRLALARSLLLKPQILLFDEATSALDPEIEEEFCRHLGNLAKELHLTILAVTHRPYWLKIADQVARLEKGRIEMLDLHHRNNRHEYDDLRRANLAELEFRDVEP